MLCLGLERFLGRKSNAVQSRSWENSRLQKLVADQALGILILKGATRPN